MKALKLVFGFIVMLALIAVISFVPSDAHASSWRVFTGAWSHHPTANTETKSIQVEGHFYEKVYSEKWDNWYYDWVYKNYTIERKPMQLNETHNLLAIQYEKILVGYFKNSFYDHSALAGYNIYHRSYEHFDVDLYVGLTYGYRDCFAKFTTTYTEYKEKSKTICPLAVPMVTYTGSDLVQPYVALFGSALAVGLSWAF